MSFAEKYKHILELNSLSEFATDRLADSFERLTVRMLEINEHFNLTAIRDEDGIILKHYADSLTAAALMPEGASVIDVGCGAGFPSLPLAIARPDLRITALDSTAKRIAYIRETAEIFGLRNITAVAARAEDLSHSPELREQFDISCARAVARLNVLCEYCLPYVKKGGAFIAMKAKLADEVDEAATAIRTLGGRLISADSFELRSDAPQPELRSLVTVKKISRTPDNYPRSNAQIAKKPL